MTQTQTKPRLIRMGDILKSEADHLSRIEIPAPPNTKMGDLVDYDVRKKKLVALSDEKDGKVLVQPHNCVINLDFVNLGSVKAETLIKDGDAYGIKYIAPNSQKSNTQLNSLPLDPPVVGSIP